MEMLFVDLGVLHNKIIVLLCKTAFHLSGIQVTSCYNIISSSNLKSYRDLIVL